ncbi:amino-acid N-acetyltransferase [Neisseriaceae bacterium CLB008]|nr:amino-acid N-acetyltransferase [Neisseriaceae bacterium]
MTPDTPVKPTSAFVQSFREAAPYIHLYRHRTFVLAISSRTVYSGRFLEIVQDINLLSSLGIRVVLVHGLRTYTRALMKHEAKTNPPLEHGRHRVTTPDALAYIKQAAGLIRFEIEAALSMGLPNSPMQGARLRVSSGNFITAKPLGVLDGIDMQHTGSIRKIDTDGIKQRLHDENLVLVSPIGYSLSGELFSLNMEEVASQLAIKLGAEKLIYLVEGQGAATADGQRISTLTAQEAKNLLERTPQAEDVQRVLPQAIQAVSEGVNRAHLLSSLEDGAMLQELFTRNGTGTSLARDSFITVREANIDDIADIINLIRPLEERGVLIKRSREELEHHINEYSILVHDHQTYGCVALYPYPEENMAELGCLAVAPEKRAAGYGELLLSHIEYRARIAGYDQLFALTTQTSHWFTERGFKPTNHANLPAAKRAQYDEARHSKVLIKDLNSY